MFKLFVFLALVALAVSSPVYTPLAYSGVAPAIGYAGYTGYTGYPTAYSGLARSAYTPYSAYGTYGTYGAYAPTAYSGLTSYY